MAAGQNVAGLKHQIQAVHDEIEQLDRHYSELRQQVEDLIKAIGAAQEEAGRSGAGK
jgi:hypothetical protein